MAETTVLDSAWMKQFIDNHIEDFRAALSKMFKDDISGRAISYIAEGTLTTSTIVSSKPLVLGGMAGDDSVAGGAALNESIQKVAADVHQVLTDHDVLFKDVESALRETITELKENQRGSLEKISPELFLDVFEDVQSGMDSSGDSQASDKSED